jgi:hypothetical protein
MEAEKSEHEDRKGGWGLFRIFWVGCALVVLYVLSIGPVMKVYPFATTRSRGFDAFYIPLRAVVERSPALRGVFYWYVYDLWRAPNILDDVQPPVRKP